MRNAVRIAVCAALLELAGTGTGYASCPFEQIIGCQEPDYMIYPDSGRTKLEDWMPTELNGGDPDPRVHRESLRLARNEIYARHGHIFKDPDLRAYFSARSWYAPLAKETPLSAVERYNVDLIQRVERQAER